MRNLKTWPPLSPHLPIWSWTMPAKEKTLNDLFLHTLKDVFYAEKQIL
jgi:hypothetical protein